MKKSQAASAKNKEWGFTELSLPRSHKGSETGVLICHGFGGTPDNMRCLYDAAVSRGFSCVMPLLSGHAKTLGDMDACSLEDWRRDAEAAYGELVSMGCRRIFLCGLSMGALLMADIAARRREDTRIAGLILMCPPVKMKLYLRFLGLVSPAVPFILTRDTFESKDTEIYCGTASRKLRDLMRLGRLVKDEAGAIACPTLLIKAGADDRVDEKSFDILMKKLPNARLAVIPGAPHGITYSPYRGEAVRLFLETVK